MTFTSPYSSSRREPTLPDYLEPGIGSRGSPRQAGAPSRLGTILLERRLITEGQLAEAILRQTRSGRRLGHVLLDMGCATEDASLDALGAQLDVATTRLNAGTVNRAAIASVPEQLARKHTAFPINKIGTTLVVAMGTPKNLIALDDLRIASRCEIQAVLALEDEITVAIDDHYPQQRMPTMKKHSQTERKTPIKKKAVWGSR